MQQSSLCGPLKAHFTHPSNNLHFPISVLETYRYVNQVKFFSFQRLKGEDILWQQWMWVTIRKCSSIKCIIPWAVELVDHKHNMRLENLYLRGYEVCQWSTMAKIRFYLHSRGLIA